VRVGVLEKEVEVEAGFEIVPHAEKISAIRKQMGIVLFIFAPFKL
jgi:hypothetical protein